MPKQDLLDPQGKAVANALHRSGHDEIAAVRIGKRIELHFDREVTEKDIENAKNQAANFLSNDVIEDVVAVTVENSCASASSPTPAASMTATRSARSG